ncbi:unnamed protein product, partial [Ectocarpus sp. 8 AP-2014]
MCTWPHRAVQCSVLAQRRHTRSHRDVRMRRPSSTSSVFVLWASLQGVDAGRSSLIAGRMAASPPGPATSGATATTFCSSSGHSSRMRWSRPEARKKPRISALTPGARSLSAAQTAWATSP